MRFVNIPANYSFNLEFASGMYTKRVHYSHYSLHKCSEWIYVCICIYVTLFVKKLYKKCDIVMIYKQCSSIKQYLEGLVLE